MSALRPFVFDDEQIRVVVDDDGEPWFVAADVCSALGLRNTSMAVSALADDERSTLTSPEGAGGPPRSTVSEAGLYRLIFTSRRPEAEAFRRWVTHDVLPAIRRTGVYAVPAQAPRELSRLELIDLAREAEVGRLRAEAAVEALLPSATAWDALASAQGDWSLRDAAQVLSRDHGVDTGQNRLAATLREIGWTDRRGVPYQRHVDGGRLVARARAHRHPHTGELVADAPQVRITPKGLGRLRELLSPSKAVVHVDEPMLSVVPS